MRIFLAGVLLGANAMAAGNSAFLGTWWMFALSVGGIGAAGVAAWLEAHRG